MSNKTPENIRIAQINSIKNVNFLSWVDDYKNCYSKAQCICDKGHKWSSSITNLIDNNRGCPECVGKRRWTAEERVDQINSISDITFVRWLDGFKNVKSKAMLKCCVDGHQWSTSVNNIVNNGTRCPKCAGVLKPDEKHRIDQINKRCNVNFVRWVNSFSGAVSKVVLRCDSGHEWTTNVDNVTRRTGCPTCASTGYDTALTGVLYALRSECGKMVKIGVSNNHESRHAKLSRTTPFKFQCVETCRGDGLVILCLEKTLHSIMTRCEFGEPFDGYTEWMAWDDRIPEWFNLYRSFV